MLYDLSPRLRPGFPVWPGDTPLETRFTWRIADGDPVNVGALQATTHLGAHVDAPLHTEERGEDVAALDLDAFLGPCQVVRVPSRANVEAELVRRLDLGLAPRLLLRTESISDRRSFPERFASITPEAARLLVEAGVVLVGIDTPSVDPKESKELPTHHVLLRAGVAILEGLILDGVPEGVYELIALPLKLDGLDASPVRAVLRTLPGRD